ncbi:SGNH/GDSL hydrolase family protein [Halobacteriovorax marinus]|nr:hypothetical protein [Halobacteriovorax marinus]
MKTTENQIMANDNPTSLKVKILIATTSLVLTLFFVEVTLRLLGEAVLEATQREYIPPFDEKNSDNHDLTYEVYNSKKTKDIKVDPDSALCVGDSFTNGGNVQSYDTYPYFLYNQFEKKGKSFSVFNFGKCESSTFDSYTRIRDFIQKKKNANEPLPGKIILLTGSADLFGVNYGSVNDSKLEPFIVPIETGVKKLRIYKIYRFFKYELFKRFSLTNPLRIPYQATSPEEQVALKKIITNSLTIFKDNKSDYSYSKEIEKKILKDVNLQLSKGFRKEVLPLESFSGNIYIERVLIYYVGMLSRRDMHKEAIDYLLGFIKDHSNFYWRDNTITAVKYYFTQAILLQSKYSSNDIHQMLIETAPKEETKSYKKILNLVNSWDENIKLLNAKREETWKDLYEMTKKEGIELILMNYPSNYQSANSMLERTAKKYNLRFVDNNSLFQKLIKRDGKEKYLYDDDHCTPEGYKIMAQNIFNTIGRE